MNNDLWAGLGAIPVYKHANPQASPNSSLVVGRGTKLVFGGDLVIKESLVLLKDLHLISFGHLAHCKAHASI